MHRKSLDQYQKLLTQSTENLVLFSTFMLLLNQNMKMTLEIPSFHAKRRVASIYKKAKTMQKIYVIYQGPQPLMTSEIMLST